MGPPVSVIVRSVCDEESSVSCKDYRNRAGSRECTLPALLLPDDTAALKILHYVQNDMALRWLPLFGVVHNELAPSLRRSPEKLPTQHVTEQQSSSRTSVRDEPN